MGAHAVARDIARAWEALKKAGVFRRSDITPTPSPDGCPPLQRPLTTECDIANGSEFLGRPLVQRLLAGTGEDQEFSGHTGRRSSQNGYTAPFVSWNHRQPVAG